MECQITFWRNCCSNMDFSFITGASIPQSNYAFPSYFMFYIIIVMYIQCSCWNKEILTWIDLTHAFLPIWEHVSQWPFSPKKFVYPPKFLNDLSPVIHSNLLTSSLFSQNVYIFPYFGICFTSFTPIFHKFIHFSIYVCSIYVYRIIYASPLFWCFTRNGRPWFKMFAIYAAWWNIFNRANLYKYSIKVYYNYQYLMKQGTFTLYLKYILETVYSALSMTAH